MKLVTFQKSGSPPAIGLVVEAGIVDLSRHLQPSVASMTALMERWADLRPAVERLANAPADVPLEAATLLAPVLRPGKIMGIGLNYADHVEESGLPKPDKQLWFAKMSSAANAPYGRFELPLASSALDYEAELAVVIGKRCKHVSREHAKDVIFGFCAANDVSVRDWQLSTSQFVLGKSFDTHAPFGPWIVTPDEVGDPHTLDIRCTVNGEERQASNTRYMVFDCYAQIEHLSQAMTLEPGDVILTGTPGGVGAAMKPPRYLKAGDVVAVTIERIGEIRHTVTPEAR
jgi:2-keto-4-pentenoate hydratase/2-oxohepta-3-ene-1,7-dioic acid hydratase in catechol pathway